MSHSAPGLLEMKCSHMIVWFWNRVRGRLGLEDRATSHSFTQHTADTCMTLKSMTVPGTAASLGLELTITRWVMLPVTSHPDVKRRGTTQKKERKKAPVNKPNLSAWEMSIPAVRNFNTKGKANRIRLYLEESSRKMLGNLWLHLMALNWIGF